MLSHLRPAVVLFAAFIVLTGLVYPLAVTGVGQVFLPSQANGSALVRDGKVVGSSLIGQSFSEPGYFWGRPSAAGAGYDARASGGSNLGPTSKALADRIVAEAARYGVPAAEIPADLLTTSASGLDPHISPAAARFQAHRIANVRQLTEPQVETLITAHIEAPALGLIGEPRVNVLKLNIALDALTVGHPR